MTERLSGSACGVPLSFDVEPALVSDVTDVLPPDWTSGPVPDGTPHWTIASRAQLITEMSAAELYMAEHAPGLVVVHAGVAAFGGRAIVLPGRSLSGKSTLTDALVRAGATYYSDEFALLAPDGRVLPYPRPITLRATPDEPARRVHAHTLRSVGDAPARVGLIAQLRHDPSADWTVTEQSAGAATLALIHNAVAAQSRPDEVLAHCAAAAGGARFVHGVRGDADAAVPELRALLEAE